MLVKVSEATNVQVDWLVAKCEGFDALAYEIKRKAQNRSSWEAAPRWAPSTDWAQGGPIIEREEIGVKRNAPCSKGREWEASPSITAKGVGGKFGYGPAPLIAAMCCYVASKFGDEIEIPEELLNASI